MNNTPEDRKSPPGGQPPRRAPAPRVTAALAAGMLGLGVAVGAAIGPAPSPSFAVGRLLPLLPSLLRAGEQSGTPATTAPPAISAQATPSAETETSSSARRRRRRKHKLAAAEVASETPATTETTTPASTAPTGTDKPKATAPAPVTKVWLIELAGSSFGEAASDPSAASYIDATATPAGTLLSGWSALQASAFANDAALIAGSSPQLLDTIVQPPCPASLSDDDASPEGEAAAGASCAADTPGALSAADEFLAATLPTITSTAAYRENGLVVVTFASVVAASATGLPTGAATATLTSQPSAGALLISPFVTAGAKSSATLDPTSPKQSLEKLLRR
ncbi:MAG TPA: hypothetical protein VMF09_01100 [Solirubrobacteraceae bacterium]|nr:hypothetical protein [Solirubrobacteraceae bacterium]